jgi:ABC-2 type transport system permease protein
MWAIFMPLLFTLLFQVVFVTLLEPKPRLGIADLGDSEITTAIMEMDGIDLKLVKSASRLRELVTNNNVDAGIVLEKGFDEAVRAGLRPNLEFYVSGESVASNRIILAVTTIDLVRKVEGKDAPVEIVMNTSGAADMPSITERLIPCIVVWVLLVGGMFVPAFGLVGEREHLTLSSLLVTPVTMTEVILSKAVLGYMMVMAMSYMTLALNRALSSEPLALFVALSIGGIICIEIGMIYGTVAGSAKTLYTLVKTLNIFLAGPVVFYLFPGLPRWIIKLFPTYWFIDPIYRISLKGASLTDVWSDLAVAVAIAAGLVLPIVLLSRRMLTKLASA